MAKLEKSAIKEMLYGGLTELTDNFRYYHKSAQGYSYWTTEGKEQMEKFITLMMEMADEAEHNEFEVKAKEYTFQTLKK